MPISSTRLPRTRLLGSGLLAGAVALSLSLAGCSSDDSEPTPSATVTEQTTAQQNTTEQSTAEQSTSEAPSSTDRPSTSARRTTGGSADAGDPEALSCRDFRALEDEGRAAVVTALGVKSNADQVATVAATACLGRLEDKVADVVGELVPTR